MTVRVVYHGFCPEFPAADQAPGVSRWLYRGGTVTSYSGNSSDVQSTDYVVDADIAPTPDQINAVLDPVPLSVTPVQARIALTAAGKRDAVEAAVAAASAQIQDYWHYSTTIELNHPIVQQMGASLSLDLPALFRAAAKIT